MRNIILASPSDKIRSKLKSLLQASGFFVYESCHTAAQLLQIANEIDDGVAICHGLTDIQPYALSEMMPYGFDLIFIFSSASYLEIASSNILVLNMPLNARDIVESVQMLAGSADLSKKVTYNNRTRNDKMLIEKAKEYLMDTYSISEPAAHKLLQKRSMQDGIPIVRIAKTILNDDFKYKE